LISLTVFTIARAELVAEQSVIKWTSGTDAVSAQDTTIFKSEPASFRVEKGSALSNVFDVKPGSVINITANVKSSDKGTFKFSVNSYDILDEDAGIFEIARLNTETGWKTVNKDINLPKISGKFSIELSVADGATGWIDDIVIKVIEEGTGTAGVSMIQSGPWKPSKGYWPKYPAAWLQTHNIFVERTKKKNIDVIFYGDSITQGWDIDGKEYWNAEIAPLKAVNYAIGGDTTRQLIYRINDKEIDGINPKWVVLQIGTNNLYADRNAGSEEDIAKGILEVVKIIRQKLPETKILLMGILPRQNDYFNNKIIRVNAYVKKQLDDKMVTYMDLGDKFTGEPGKLKTELYSKDMLHLSKAGYKVMLDEILPIIKVIQK
jgi:lysophospholipase L1-like esterase